MIKNFFCCCCLLLLMSSCTPMVSKRIVGTWKMQKVYENSKDVSAEHNPQSNRWITFTSDGSFQSGGKPRPLNGGKWIYNESDKVLYLDSDAGEGDDSYWIINVEKNEMEWSGTKSSFTERFRITLSKE